ncbi:MAG: hypothetical protein E5W82_10530 [Mesorhizobium sp.]|nr:MAG: hypothetical protein E5W82_10530 [Mesorhizobium sp.]
MTDNLKTFSVLFAWADNDREQGDYGTVVRAANHDEAESKGRADMRENHISNHCDADADEDEIAESCAEYEHTDFRGNIIFGGRLIECSEGAIWKAADLEKALRRIDARLKGEWYDPTGDLESDIAGVLRPILAELDGVE